jgi:ribosome-associated toxin RatA of RatAB toxin-antitoxin module
MASAQTAEVFNCSVEQFYKIISDYEKYPEFLKEVTKTKVVQTSGKKKLVEFEVSVIKSFKYSLWLTENSPKEVSWELASGDMFKTSVGSWKLKEEAGKCRATYFIDATFNLFVPGPIAKALVNVNLPAMMSSYHKRVADLYGKS